jgi:YbbR domain-containing protein
MEKKKHKFFQNIGLKFMALAFSVLLWFVVMNIQNPVVSKTITDIPVEMLNINSIVENGSVFDVTNGETVNVVVRGPRSIVENLEAENFDATADLSQLSVTNSTTVEVVPNASVNVKDAKKISISPVNGYVTLSIEEEVEKNIPVKVITTGNVADGYAIGNPSPTPNMITVSGPASVLENIVEARAVVGIDGAAEAITESAKVGCIDGYGTAVEKDNVTLSDKRVSVSIPVYKTKTIPVNINVAGTPREGFAVREINYNPDEITIAGDEEALAKVSSLDINDVIVTDASGTIEKNIAISEYLPADITVAEDTTEIAVSVSVESTIDKELSVAAAAVTMEGTSSEYEYSLSSAQPIRVKVTGFEDVIGGLKVDDLGPKIDVKGLGEGRHSVQISFKDTENFVITGVYSVTVEVKKAE